MTIETTRLCRCGGRDTMSLGEEIEFWKKQTERAETKESALVAFGIKAGLQMALDHADEITLNRISQLGWPFS